MHFVANHWEYNAKAEWYKWEGEQISKDFLDFNKLSSPHLGELSKSKGISMSPLSVYLFGHILYQWEFLSSPKLRFLSSFLY